MFEALIGPQENRTMERGFWAPSYSSPRRAPVTTKWLWSGTPDGNSDTVQGMMGSTTCECTTVPPLVSLFLKAAYFAIVLIGYIWRSWTKQNQQHYMYLVLYFCVSLHKESYMTESAVLSVRIHHWKESAGSAPTVAELTCVACVTWATSIMWTTDSSVSTLPPPQCKISSVHLSLHSYESFSATLLGSKYILNEATFFGHFQIRTIDEKVLNSDIFLASFFSYSCLPIYLIKLDPV